MSSEEIQDEPFVENEMEAIEDYWCYSAIEVQAMERYKNALLTNNYAELEFIRSMGDSVRQRIMNINSHEHAKLFGYDEIEFDKYGWLERNKWEIQESVLLEIKEQGIGNKVRLAMGRNGKWTFGYSLTYGSGSGSSSPTSYTEQSYDSREQALEYALQLLYSMFFKAQDHVKDTTNYNKKHIEAMLKSIQQQLFFLGKSPEEQKREQTEPKIENTSLLEKAKQKLFHAPQLSLFGDNVQLTF